jgi:transcriptional regulator with XRE-family HTH domain
MLTRESVAGRIWRLRKERGLTQSELADLVGTTQSTVSAIERGRKPTLELAQKIADVFEINLEELDPFAGLRSRGSHRCVVTYVGENSVTDATELQDGARDWQESLPVLARVLEQGTLLPDEVTALETLAKGILARLQRSDDPEQATDLCIQSGE